MPVLRLIQPSQYKDGRLIKYSRVFVPRLTLPTLAALTPDDFKVTLTDEYVQDIDFDEPCDLVGITSLTAQAPRAYEIADEFRARGVKVILGGIHSTACPEEAKKHADAVVLGEAETIWRKLLEDFQEGKLTPFYKAVMLPDLKGFSLPRFSLLDLSKYETFAYSKKPLIPIQTSRGCPHGCDFCSVTAFFGRGVRYRPIEEVITEVKSQNADYYFFVDDNIAVDYERAKALFEALVPLRIKWFGQFDATIHRREDLVKLAAKSGCFVAFIGLESLSVESLKGVGKSFSPVSEYGKIVKMFRNAGVLMYASFIFGFDEDDETVFERTVDFLESNRVPVAAFAALTPLPGTMLFRRLEAEQRIIEDNWSKFDLINVVICPKQMSAEKLRQGLWDTYDRFYSRKSVFRRLFFPPTHRILEAWDMNLTTRKMLKKRIHLLSGGITDN
jgi:radical SAM superfamily enzyme YgiQ (UPF0313 family)